jgi:hypothetical protein
MPGSFGKGRLVGYAVAVIATALLLAFTEPALGQDTSEKGLVQPSTESAVLKLVAQLSEIERAEFPGKGILTEEDEEFLDDLQQRAIRFFMDEADPETGLMPDRAKADGSGAGDVSSIASIGFGLTALCIGEYRGWVPRQEAYDRSLKVLKFLRDKAHREHGHFYHFLDMKTGERSWNCEISNIDTALLMCGVLTVRQHFAGTELAALADELYRGVEWGWLTTADGTLSMGWKPESGFIPARWSQYNEGWMIILLGLGSPTHPLPASAWDAWKRYPVVTYAGLTFLQCPPLFTHQYPQCWFDLRGQNDGKVNYFANSQLATVAHWAWTQNVLQKRFPTYGPRMWGLTASDSERGYTVWGGPPEDGKIDGSVVPCAAGGSLAFVPRLCLDALQEMREKFGERGYLKYGFVDAFNPATGWYNPDVIGIDVGATVVMAENLRSGFVWKTFMSAPEAREALRVAGFKSESAQEAGPPTSALRASLPGDSRGAGSDR